MPVERKTEDVELATAVGVHHDVDKPLTIGEPYGSRRFAPAHEVRRCEPFFLPSWVQIALE
jgi:hypothetical protein